MTTRVTIKNEQSADYDKAAEVTVKDGGSVTSTELLKGQESKSFNVYQDRTISVKEVDVPK